MSSPEQPLTSRRNPFTFDTQEEKAAVGEPQKLPNYFNDSDCFSSEEEAEETLVGDGELKGHIEDYQKKLQRMLM